LGVHPHEAKFYSQEVEDKIKTKAKEKYLIGIGEIGLDYYYNHSEPQVQRDAFHRQMELAHNLGLPVEIHSRDAEEDTLKELRLWKNKVRGMLHCFSGSQKMAEEALSLGFFISLSGVVTFKNAESLRETLKSVPLDRVLVETDAPFLAPVPMRGKKNKPAYVSHTAEKVAEVKGITLEELSSQLRKNVKDLFPKWNI
jgi:TatD DNase family protein